MPVETALAMCKLRRDGFFMGTTIEPTESGDGSQPGAATMESSGLLPDWQTADMPEPLPFSLKNIFRTVGPGAVLLVGSIGAGEWIVGPMVAVNNGTGILWVASVAILLQAVLNLEACRYTLYTGEPILTGCMRLRPGPRFWGGFYILLGIIQLGTPAVAVGCANVIVAGVTGKSEMDPAGESWVLVVSAFLVLATAMLLLSGRSVEKVLERISWFMVIVIFGFLFVANCMFVPHLQWAETAKGFVTYSPIPRNMDVLALATFAAMAGSGGLGNLAISNWYRDKGFGMGALVGGIGGVLSSKRQEVDAHGCVFPTTESNLRRWRTWVRYMFIDLGLIWAFGCVIGMFLNVNLAVQLMEKGTQFTPAEAGVFQAAAMSNLYWKGFWFLTLANGFWILFSTHLGNTDVLVRTVTDVIWAGSPRAREYRISSLYAVLLIALSLWGLVSMRLGNVLDLFKILGGVASPIMTIAGIQIFRVNTKLLPPELRPNPVPVDC